MKNDLTVLDVMSTELITLHPKDNITRAKKIFREYQIHHIPICVMDDLRGIISLGDILFLEGLVLDNFDQFLQDKRSQLTPVENVMTSNPYHITSKDSLASAIQLMLDKRVNALPVVDAEKLVGLITTRDILTAFQSVLIN